MGSLEDRLRRLEERLIRQPSVDEYLDASNRQQVRALHVLSERLQKYGFDGDYLFVEANQRMLAEDTPERRERDRETVEAWHKAQGRDRAIEVEGAKERLLAILGDRSTK
jgi:CRP-like cAMP-binding protein